MTRVWELKQRQLLNFCQNNSKLRESGIFLIKANESDNETALKVVL